MQKNRMNAELRSDFGKGYARRTRAAGKVPGVIYSRHLDAPIHVTLPGHEVFMVLKSSANAVIEMNIEGGEKQLVLVKDVQRHPVSRNLQHVDLLAISRKEKVDVDVPVVVVGESASGTIHTLEAHTLPITVPAVDIPESIEVSVEGLEEGTVIRLSDMTLPEDAECTLDPDTEIVSISVPQAEAEPEPAEGEGEATSEGEVAAAEDAE
ncbi:50S ribosomal protein L25/general stress protein Ctc [Boudabousia marimammalium]|uniref:Large ribosomal subunit protein bL25 n=1 Tax=Boudabousia marimammalium TaxID=156892 RepID=A0A1Q5PRX4_9ACTO|nr:50S ribosomal protein L25/general stress protein Ctc [Boudabousia marimammalium]OKL50334.1 50S ribosomal protein L25/general stress protein Ctc [Boudabousia marimammalium]